MVKYSQNYIMPYLVKLFNLILSSGVYPDQWKTSYINLYIKEVIHQIVKALQLWLALPNYLGSGYSAGPSQIVTRGYSTGPGQIVPRLFSRTWLNSYNAHYRLFDRTKMFYAKVFKDFWLLIKNVWSGLIAYKCIIAIQPGLGTIWPGPVE